MIGAHRDSGEHAADRHPGADQPVAAVVGRSEDRVDPRGEQRAGRAFHQPRVQLRGIHADQEDRERVERPSVVDGAREALAERSRALYHDVTARWHPGTGLPLEGHDPELGPGAGDHAARVGQCGLSQLGGLLRASTAGTVGS